MNQLTVFELYEKLAKAFSPSGRENDVREIIRSFAEKYTDDISVDTIGNLICRKRPPVGSSENVRKIVLTAHMDSIGIVATYIDDKGLIRFGAVGGIAPQDLLHTSVRFANGTRGVIAHEEKTDLSKLQIRHFYIDIGAKNQADAQELVKIGDFAIFDSPCYKQNDTIFGAYIDNRIGCAVLMQTMSTLPENLRDDIYFVFTAQEEVGLRGAQTAAYSINPDIAIAVDVTDTGDLPEQNHPMDCKMGKGPAIKVMDRSVICSMKIRSALEEAALLAAIPVQREIMQLGGTDTSAFQRTHIGVEVGALSIPTRYIHTPCEVCSESDAEYAVKLLRTALIDTL